MAIEDGFYARLLEHVEEADRLSMTAVLVSARREAEVDDLYERSVSTRVEDTVQLEALETRSRERGAEGYSMGRVYEALDAYRSALKFQLAYWPATMR